MILNFYANAEEISIAVGSYLRPRTFHFTPFFQPNLSSLPRHPEEGQVFDQNPVISDDFFAQMTHIEALDELKKARLSLCEIEGSTRVAELRRKYEEQFDLCLQMCLSSKASFRRMNQVDGNEKQGTYKHLAPSQAVDMSLNTDFPSNQYGKEEEREGPSYSFSPPPSSSSSSLPPSFALSHEGVVDLPAPSGFEMSN